MVTMNLLYFHLKDELGEVIYNTQRPSFYEDILHKKTLLYWSTMFPKIVKGIQITQNNAIPIKHPQTGITCLSGMYKVPKFNPNDEYINSLLPKIREQVYEDSGYCEAHRMSIHPTKRAYSEEESKYIADAKLKYDKDAHRRWLIRNKINEFIKGTSAIYQDKISIIKAFTQEMDKLIKDENINRSFVKEHNKFLRDSIRKAHDYKFAGYYSKD